MSREKCVFLKLLSSFFESDPLTNFFKTLTPYTILDALEPKRFRLFFIFFQNSANIFHYSQSSDFIVVLVIGMILQMVIFIESGCQCFFVMCFPFFIFHYILSKTVLRYVWYQNALMRSYVEFLLLIPTLHPVPLTILKTLDYLNLLILKNIC